MVRKIFIFYFIINLFNYVNSNEYKIIATVNNDPITQIDLENEIKILSILNKVDISNKQINIALINLIEERIKKKEIINEKISIDNNIINNHFFELSRNLDLNLNDLDKNLILLIKEKIKIDKNWNSLIINKYGWKISVNMKEIDEKIKYKDKEKNLNNIKNKLILDEKNKKLSAFSRFHLNKLKEQSLIKFYK